MIDECELLYYVNVSLERNITKRELREIIKNGEYKRLSNDAKEKLINREKLDVKDLVPNPILIKNKNSVDVVNEKLLHQLILEDITGFMKELGNGYSYIDNEYKIKTGDYYYKIDLLFFNIKYNAYVVVELKVTEFKVEYIS